MRKTNRKKAMSDINVVPYIDVMLVLLLIFMITAPLLTEGVQVNLPEAQAKAIKQDSQEPIIVSVDAQGLYYLNISEHPQEAINADALANRVAAELTLAKQAGKKRNVMVKGDQQVDYGKVVQAMVLLQAAGAKSVGLITSPTSSQPAPSLMDSLRPKAVQGA